MPKQHWSNKNAALVHGLRFHMGALMVMSILSMVMILPLTRAGGAGHSRPSHFFVLSVIAQAMVNEGFMILLTGRLVLLGLFFVLLASKKLHITTYKNHPRRYSLENFYSLICCIFTVVISCKVQCRFLFLFC